MRTALVLSLVSFLLSCAGINVQRERSLLDKVADLPLGSTAQDIESKIGTPNESSVDGDETRLTFTIPYKKLNLPKATFWLDKSGKVVAKRINLFSETGDAMTKEEVERKFKHSKFVVEDAKILKGMHYIPSEKYLRDRTNGISAEFRPHMNNGVYYIRWNIPEISRNTSAENP